MPTILHIESSTLTCSVAISKNGKVAALRESHDESYAHSEKLVVYIDESLQESGLNKADLDAVCVVKGPGSYTGLRIGVSAAKGLCYGLEIPLISVGSLTSIAQWAKANFEKEVAGAKFICPMIDARRMEVYTQLFSTELKELTSVKAEVIDNFSFQKQLELGKVVFVGDGAEKCKDVIQHSNAVFLSKFQVSAQGMIQLAEHKLARNQLEDVAYFEPYYLKDFVAGKPKKIF